MTKRAEGLYPSDYLNRGQLFLKSGSWLNRLRRQPDPNCVLLKLTSNQTGSVVFATRKPGLHETTEPTQTPA